MDSETREGVFDALLLYPRLGLSSRIGNRDWSGLLRTVWFPVSGSLISHIATPTTVVCI